ncbi:MULTISPECIES: hypothetical protein [Paenibacillus]|uniref:Cell division protein FtsL n=1 Tax=Paenibacillus albilobatus TaxID=2716884 RepID=A0A920CA49_9BACL|nr:MULTISPECIES: hypothetical protein [Paenibacillus]MDR9853006.1 hypothetical protein [Paenibacillus sp. VCA1]GIO30538.1 hypothetical protein J2TS6_16790 [Paenibacillus albilobatus]
MAYTRGNLAVKEQAQTKRTSPGYREKTMVVTRRTQLPIKEKLLYLFTIVVCVMIASLIIWQNANIYGLNKQYQKIDKSIKASKQEISRLTVEKQQLEVGIRDKAKQMGFEEPADGQVINVERSPISAKGGDAANGSADKK